MYTSTCKNEVIAQTRCFTADPKLTVEILQSDVASDHSVLYMPIIEGLNSEIFFSWLYKNNDDRRMIVKENFFNAVEVKLRTLYHIISNWEIELSNIMITNEGEILIIDFKNVINRPDDDVEDAVDTAVLTLVEQYFNLEYFYERNINDEEYKYLETMIQSFMVARESPDIRFRGETMDDIQLSLFQNLQNSNNIEYYDDDLDLTFDNVLHHLSSSALTNNMTAISIHESESIDRGVENSVQGVAEITTQNSEEEVQQTFINEIVDGRPSFDV